MSTEIPPNPWDMDHNSNSTINDNSSAELAGQTAVVTGASKGIGRAIALELAAAGADVLVHGHSNGAAARKVAEEVRRRGGGSAVLLYDLADSAQQQRMFEEAWSWRKGVDIWVNNAGADVLTGRGTKETFEEKIERLWRVDVMSTIRLSRLAGKRMRQTGGVIINMGWDQVDHGMAGDSGEMFAAIKGAVMAFSRSLAQSLAPNVRVNCLAPGWIRTAWGQQASPQWQTRARGDSLSGRWGTPEDVARVARFLVSPAAGFINGQCVAINGGFQYGPRSSS